MNRFSKAWKIVSATISLLSVLPLHAKTDMDPAPVFAEAQKAYDAGDLAGAEAHYREMLASGWQTPEVLFNLGNTLFRAGRTGEAIASFREAQYLAPQDPDIKANLAFALQKAGADAPSLPLYQKIAFLCSRTIWKNWLTAGLWLVGLAVTAAFLFKKSLAALFWRAAGAGVFVCLVSLQSLFAWNMFERHPEAIVTKANAEVRFAPLPDATTHFPVQEGMFLRVDDASLGWLQVTRDGKSGFIEAEACSVLSSPGKPRQ